MTLTLLLDLDDTLLANNIATFLPVYLQALANHLAPHTDRERIVPTLLAATQEMIQNQRPDRSLSETFEAAFFPALGMKRDALIVLIDEFYAEVFPTLQAYTNVKPAAISLVETAVQRGYRLVIATNPLFPRTAILQRLVWAGISPERHPFSLVTSYETFHFSKPNPAYYAEILARLGWPEGVIVMVGDNLENDITGARCLGLPAFWITQNGISPPSGPYGPSGAGSLADLIPWLDSTPHEQLDADFNKSESILAILRSTPAALDSLTKDLKEEYWRRRPALDEWALNEIICHLRDGEVEVHLPRTLRVLQEENPFISGRDTDPWAEERHYIEQDGPQALVDFTKARVEMLDVLTPIGASGWARPARHAIFGPTDLQELVGIVSTHDRLHVHQAYETIKIITARH